MPATVVNDLVRQLRTAEPTTDSDLLDRYLTLHDEEAFAALVQRHQRTVLSACRQVLGPGTDVDDAFQATFLVLLSRARSARWRASLGGWLYAVAHRIAVRMRSSEHRRTRRESHVARRAEAPAPVPDLSWQEAVAVLHEELDRLPDRFRLPLLLCYLEGLSRDEAATQLGWTPGTLRGRLARGRRALARRLTRRGITLSAGLLAVVTGSETTALAAPPNLIGATLQTARGTGSARAIQLARTGLSSFRARLKVALGLVAVFGLCLGLLAGEKTPKEIPHPAVLLAADEKKPDAPPPDPATELRYAGVVLDPAGKPLAGATVHISGLQHGVIEFKPRAQTGADGKFDFVVKKDEFRTLGPTDQPGTRVMIGATAPNCGAVTASGADPKEREKFVLWLPEEQIVTGRVIDTEGKPIAGVSIGASLFGGKLDKNGKPMPFDSPEKETRWFPNFLPHHGGESVKTDKDGRFTLRGVAKDWLYSLYISGAGVQTLRAQLVGRPQKQETAGGVGLSTPDGRPPKLVRYGSEFTHVALRDRPISGVVRDKATGKPLADVSVSRPFVRDPEPPLWATTDKDGRFRIDGIVPGEHELRVNPGAGQPYLTTTFKVDSTEGAVPFDCTLELVRQRMIVGRVTDLATGKPVAGSVEYRASGANPNLKGAPDLAQPRWNSPPTKANIDKDGKFALPTIAGRGVLLVEANGTYRPARLSEADRKAVPTLKDDAALLDTKPFPVLPALFHAVRAVELPKEGGDLTIDLTVDAGRSVALDLKYPQNKPRETWVLGLAPAVPLSTDRTKEFNPKQDRVGGLAPDEPRHLFALTRDGALGGHKVLTGGETDSVTLELKPTGGITGRLVGADGKPLPSQGFQLYYADGAQGVYMSGGFSYRLLSESQVQQLTRLTGRRENRWGGFSMPEKSGADGTFRIAQLIPDVDFDLWVVCVEEQLDKKTKQAVRRITGYVKVTSARLKPDETKDLGDLVVKNAN
jgi:RNA polymerase sigma factor (sigma-70 family)